MSHEVPVATRRTPFNNNTIVMAKIKVLPVGFQKSSLRKEIWNYVPGWWGFDRERIYRLK
jgi:hypothetical protein